MGNFIAKAKVSKRNQIQIYTFNIVFIYVYTNIFLREKITNTITSEISGMR